MKIIGATIVSLITLAFCLFLSGSIPMDSYFPPLAKILFPKTGLWQNAESYEQDFTLKSENVKEEFKVIFDDRMVAHIYASNLSDALFAQGYIQARDRLFQMDLSTRSAAGRLCEIVGDVAINHDIQMRKEGMAAAAMKAVEHWSQQNSSKVLDSYVAGINAYIEELSPKNYPFEFKLLNYAPELWSYEKSALVQKLMERMLCGVDKDIQLTNMKSVLGDSLFNQVYPNRNPYDTPVIPEEVVYDFDVTYDEFSPEMNIIDSFPHPIQFKSNKGIGSNNWAVNGLKSKTGNAILSNDPHLKLSLPSIWHEIHIVTPEFNARGVSIPGVPGILVGFNEHIAWGTTNVGQDVKDYYQIKYATEDRSQYVVDGANKKVELREELIKIRNRPDSLLQVRVTDWGPIVYDSGNGNKDLAMSWLPFNREKHDDFLIFSDILKAKNYDEYLRVMDAYHTPAQNFVGASKDGTIGLRVTGLFPAKQFEDGRFVKDGSKSKSGYDTYIPIEQLAQVKNPTSGYVASANQYSTSEDYPYYYTSEYFENFRGRRINEMLLNQDSLSIEDMMRMQQDVFNLKAAELLPFFLESVSTLKLTDFEQKFIDSLTNWNYRFEAHLTPPTIFDAWSKEYKQAIYDEVQQAGDRMTVSYPDYWLTNHLSLNDPNHKIFDDASTPAKESAVDLARQTFKSITRTDEYLKPWAAYRNFSIPHIAQFPGLGTEALEVGGNGDVVNAIDFRFAPSWRMVVALGDEPEAYGVYPGGQSGNPNSEFYDNSVSHWATGEYHKLELLKEDEIKQANLQITLKPR